MITYLRFYVVRCMLISFYYLYNKLSHYTVDIDECLSHNGGCDSYCKNTMGSFICSCSDGYSLTSDYLSCAGMLCLTDCFTPKRWVGCLQAQVIQSVFKNIHCYTKCDWSSMSYEVMSMWLAHLYSLEVPSSWFCYIQFPKPNLQICLKFFCSFTASCTVDINECTKGMDDCQQLCINKPGTFECSCNYGYELGEDGTTCTGQSNIVRLILLYLKLLSIF